MANLTLSVDERVLQRARIRAIKEGTSVNAAVQLFLERYAGTDPRARGLRRFVAEARRSDAGSGPSGRSWTREELYSERADASG